MPMKKITYLILFLTVLSCNIFKEKSEFIFTYEFENENQITQREILETINILKKRLDKYGVEHKIKKEKRKRLSIKVTGFNLDSIRLNNLITNQGKLEFWELYNREGFNDFILEVDRFFTSKLVNDSLKEQSLVNKIASVGYQGGSIVFQSKTEDTAAVNKMILHKDVRFFLPPGYLNTKFLWGIADNNGHHPLYAAKSNRDNKPPLSGASIVDAFQSFDPIGRPVISMKMSDKAALTWERITGKAFKNRTCIAIALNNLVYTAPGVTVGAIKGGQSEISGNFTLEQAQDLAIILSSQGSVPKLKLVNK